MIQVKQKDIPIWKKWVGTLDGLVDAQIKPQVTGLSTSPDLQGRLACKKRNLLFEIDPRTFQAALDQTKGQLANRFKGAGVSCSEGPGA